MPARPPKKPWNRWVSLGLYVGATGNPELVWEKIAQDLYLSEFNAISIHFMSPWDNEGGIYPVIFDPNTQKYQMNEPDESYYANIETMIETLAYYWIGIEICFFDSYFEAKWIDDQPFHYHPFRNNNFGKNWGAKADVKWFYDGWVPGRGFLWVSWEDVSNYVFKNYKAIPPMGQPILNYMKRIVEIVKKVRMRFPGCRIRYKTYNETVAMMEQQPNGDIEADASRSRGDRIEIQSYTRDLFKSILDPTQPPAVGYVDYIALLAGKVHIPTIAEAANDWIRKMRMNLEVHYAYTKQQTQDMLSAGVPRTSLFSCDGKREAPEVHYGTGDSPYFTELKGVESLKLPSVDYKLWARYSGPKRWRVGDMMWNWNEFFPFMAQIF